MTEILFKVLIVGDATVGKTSFVQRYVNDAYRKGYKPTLGGKNDHYDDVIPAMDNNTPHYSWVSNTPHYSWVSNTPHYSWVSNTPHYSRVSNTPHYSWVSNTPHHIA